MIRSSKVPGNLFVLMTALVLLVGCSGGGYGESASKPADKTEASTGQADVAIEISPEAAAVLAMADLADGDEDHVVSKCASCNLAMDGKAENALKVGEYEMYFCSDTCSRRFRENTEAAVLSIPQP